MKLSLWPFRLALARLRPVNLRLALKIGFVGMLFALFLWGDHELFRRVFAAAARIEALSPFFALGLIENFLGLVFLVSLLVLFFSSLTSAIGALFTDLDLELYHAAPVSAASILISRWAKTLVQSSYLVVFFLLPMFVALAGQYRAAPWLSLLSGLDLLVLLSIPVSLSCTVVLLLVRFFPVRRVHQIAATLAILILTLVVVGIRMARPERLFTEIGTDELQAVLAAIDLPASEYYPSRWLAAVTAERAFLGTPVTPELRIVLLGLGAFLVYLWIGRRIYLPAFIRARESSAPVALGSSGLTALLDLLTRHADPQTRAMFGKEIRVVTRDATQWSQLFMMIALLFLYLYNIQMMPLEGDYRAPILAYVNLAMGGFVVAAICLRFAYPSLSAEGRQFWILASSPVSVRRLLWVKVLVYLIPLVVLSLLLTILANLILDAPRIIWFYTVPGTLLVTTTLVAAGVGMGAIAPNFDTENPVEVALSLGGLAYMALSLLYVGLMLFLFARPMQRIFLRIALGMDDFLEGSRLLPMAAALGISFALSVVPVEIARFRLTRNG